MKNLGLTKTRYLGRIRLKHMGSFALKESPVATTIPTDQLIVDRWGPVGDRDKDMISSIRQVGGEWFPVKDGVGVWFGFEGEGKIYPQHIYEYYNLIVVRWKMISEDTAIKYIEAELELK